MATALLTDIRQGWQGIPGTNPCVFCSTASAEPKALYDWSKDNLIIGKAVEGGSWLAIKAGHFKSSLWKGERLTKKDFTAKGLSFKTFYDCNLVTYECFAEISD
jgi:hypothetical protein